MRKKIVLLILGLILPSVLVASEKNKAKDSTSLDPGLVVKVKATYSSVFDNDDKKAKLYYGRNYKYMPEVMQFALDLRFRNFEHALSILPKTGKSLEEIHFWENIIRTKNLKLNQTLCENLKKSELFNQPLSISHEEELWSEQVSQLKNDLSEKDLDQRPKNNDLSKYDEILGAISCKSDVSGSIESCAPLTEAQKKIILVEGFFDELHNMQRRDTRFVTSNFHNLLKLNYYNRYIALGNLQKLFYSLKEIESPFVREHFLKRLGGLGRDIRPEGLQTRRIGDDILRDKKDHDFLAHLDSFVASNPLLNYSIGLEYELASCGLTPK